jgi:hypothetical protein
MGRNRERTGNVADGSLFYFHLPRLADAVDRIEGSAGQLRERGTIRGIAHSIQAANSSMCAISAATTSPASRRIARPDCFRLLGNMRRLERRRS